VEYTGFTMDIRLDGRRNAGDGASSGIGEAIAVAPGRCGGESGNQLCDSSRSGGCRRANHQTEKRARRFRFRRMFPIPKRSEEMFRQIDLAWGGVDILINKRRH